MGLFALDGYISHLEIVISCGGSFPVTAQLDIQPSITALNLANLGGKAELLGPNGVSFSSSSVRQNT